MRIFPIVFAFVAGVSAFASGPAHAGPMNPSRLSVGQDDLDLLALSVEELMNVKITSLSKREEPLAQAPAAVHVITSDEIRRSGYTSVAEVLRLVPGMQVARSASNGWSIGTRGFATGLSNKLLVLIDGRSVYTPFYGGVFWDTQDLPLDDIDRIEVIHGPGGALWGANAVNGIINVVTKPASRTTGEYLSGGAGNAELGFGQVRYGRAFARERLHVRTWGKYFDRAPGHREGSFAGAEDSWRIGRAGLRADWTLTPNDDVTIDAGYHDGEAGANGTAYSLQPPYATPVSRFARRTGAHGLVRWSHALGASGNTQLQLYYDRTHRDYLIAREVRETVDVDFQHRVLLGSRHEVVWGAGYRLSVDAFSDNEGFAFSNPDRKPHLVSGFAQDQMTVVPERLFLTLGSKVEHNDYTGLEYQPSARTVWAPDSASALWASAARAIRTPTRLEVDADWALFVAPPGTLHPTLPALYTFTGTEGLESEEVLALELGARRQFGTDVTVDAAAFTNSYTGLLSGEVGTPYVAAEPDSHMVIPFYSGSFLEAKTHGGELSVNWQATPWARAGLSYAYLEMDLTLDPQSTADPTSAEAQQDQAPQHQARLRSSFDLPRGVELDAIVRYVDRIPGFDLDSYIDLDLRLGWRLPHGIELALAGQNLLDEHRFESSGSNVSAVERTFYVQITSRR